MDNTESKEKQLKLIIFPLSFLILLWLIQFAQYLFLLKLVKYGLLPQTTKGLTGIFTAPLIHSGFNHIISNSIPLLFLVRGIFYFYKEAAYMVFFLVYFIPGLLAWFLGWESCHIGSGG